MKRRSAPSVSIVIPTLNSGRTIERCLRAISQQDYRGKMEIIVADGGSSDITLKVARMFKAKVVRNALKTGEAGKAVGAKFSSGEIIAFIDSDNILPDKGWLTNMIIPFLKDGKIVASEPLYFTYRKKDHWLTRYFALLGMGDPLSLFIGNYDRFSYVTGRWTDLDIKITDFKDYMVLYLKKDTMPTIGANGFLIRGKKLLAYPVRDYLFDIDLLKYLAGSSSVKVAKVKTGIIHLFTGDIRTFARKQKRRINDYLYFKKRGMRIEEQNQTRLYIGVVKFCFATVLVVPVLFQTLKGFIRKQDIAWLFHPLACLVTLYIYGSEFIKFQFAPGFYDRKRWSQ